MTANLIVWGIVQSANLQSVLNQMSQRDQTQASERVSLLSALFGNTNKYSSTVAPFTASAGTARTLPVANMNFTSNANGWIFTKVLAPGTSSGISGGFDSGGTEVGAVGSPSGPGLIYMGVSYFPPSGTSTYSATWSNRVLVDLSKFGLSGSQTLLSAPACSGPNCPIVASWAWTLPRVNPGVIQLTVKLEIADPFSLSTACTAPHCYVVDSQTYTTLADQTWNYRKVTWGGLLASGTATAGTSTTLTDGSQSWTTDQWKNYFVSITSGTGAGQSRLITSTTAPNSLTVSPSWSITPDATSHYTISLTNSDTATSAAATTLVDSGKAWYANQWQNYFVSITSGTGAGQTIQVASNTATTLTLSSAWSVTPDATSRYLIGCSAATFCGFDVASGTFLSQTPTTYTPTFWGTANAQAFYTVQVESDFTLSQSANPSEVRLLFDDIGLAFGWPAFFSTQPGSPVSGSAIIDIPLTNGENTGLIQQLTASIATAYNTANVQESRYIKDYTTGVYVPLASGLVSQQTVNTTAVFTGADVQKYIGTQTAQGILNLPNAVVFDSSGNLWVCDQANNRILEFTSLLTNANAALELGQPSGSSQFVTSSAATSATGLNKPNGITFDSTGNLWVADTGNNRVLEFAKGGGFTNGQAASIVIGQSTFTSSASATTASGLTLPSSVRFDAAGNLWVSDQGNNRVLEYLAPLSTGMSATLVLGQSSFTTSSPPPGSGTATSATATTLVDTGQAWATNQWANGIVSITSGTGSGQSRTVASNTATTLTIANAWTVTPAAGSGYSITPASTTQASLNGPDRIRFDASGNLWVSDAGSNRILEYVKGGGFSNGQAAGLVLGQASFTASAAATTSTGLSGPAGVEFDSGGNLWVGDTGNNRVLRFATPFSNGEAAGVVIGQSSFVTNAAATTQAGLNAPQGIAFDSGGNLWVADRTNYRVLKFATPLSTGESAGVVLGQADYITASHPVVEFKITAQNPLTFQVATMKASVQDFFKDPNHVSIQVSNSWASTSHLVDIFVSDSSGIHCFSRVATACGGALVTSTVTGSTSTTITDTSQNWSVNQWAGDFVCITGGAASGQYSQVASNTANTLTLTGALTTLPGVGSAYQVGIGACWGGVFVAPATTAVVALTYTWANGPVSIKVTTDLGNTVVLNTNAG